jgi:hypothetical protein
MRTLPLTPLIVGNWALLRSRDLSVVGFRAPWPIQPVSKVDRITRAVSGFYHPEWASLGMGGR